MAPLQADLPLTGPEDLSPILNKLWDAAIPHVTLIVPENPDASNLIRAVERAEDLGMITGVRGRATDLQSGQLVFDMVQAGIDHVTIFYGSGEHTIHDSLFGDGDYSVARELFAEIPQYEVATVAEIPLLTTTVDGLSDLVESLIELEVRNFSFFAIARPDEAADSQSDDSLLAMALPQVADIVEELANQLDVRFVWQPPVLREESISFIPQVRLGPRSSGDVSIRVEPNGDVIPSRGPYRRAGNILIDSWDEIWRDPAFRRYRERIEQPTRCEVCPGLAICAADCPREFAGWSQGSEGISK
jgi:radical SAM protein with 4Fe4S-binding SPASM domain